MGGSMKSGKIGDEIILKRDKIILKRWHRREKAVDIAAALGISRQMVYYIVGKTDIREKNQVRNKEIRIMRRTEKLSDIAKKFGLSEGRISQICGRTGSIKNDEAKARLSISVPESLGMQIREEAGRLGISISGIIQEAVSYYFKKTSGSISSYWTEERIIY